MILFVFEGKQREPALFQTMQRLFFPKGNEPIVCSFGNNLYQLYKELNEYDGDGDIVLLLKEKFSDKDENPFRNFERSSDFSEIYLFFDYDFQNTNLSLDEINRQVDEMLDLFDDETLNGKLYINYPMIESLRYTKKLPDPDYYKYTVRRSDCNKFKKISDEFSTYKSFDFVQVDQRGKVSKEKLGQIGENWRHLKDQNVCKANYICAGINKYPESKDDISQQKIFTAQKSKYVFKSPACVSILNAFPLFLYDYFK
jgi:hypothetical protein